MAHVATITIDHTKVPGDLTDYVGLIVPDGSAGYSALYALCLEGGGDIRLFKSDDTTELAREIVSFSVSAETGEIHYKYSGTLSSSVDTDIHVYADGSSADYAVTATYGRNNVWDDYEVVLHLKETSGSIAVNSVGSNNFSYVGSLPNYSATLPLGGQNLDGAGDWMQKIGTIFAGDQDPLTYQMWLNLDNLSGDYGQNALIGEGKNGINQTRNYLYVGESTEEVLYDQYPPSDNTVSSSGYSFAINTNILLHFTKSSNTSTFFKNGSSVSSGTHSETYSGGTPDKTFIGAVDVVSTRERELDGDIGEVRIKTTALPANYITTEYNNQNSYSTFYSVAAVAGGSTSAQAARRGVIMMM